MPDSIPNLRDHTGERLGTYRLLRRLAIGGMAEIYLASASEGARRYVVIKLLRGNFARDPEFVRLFLDEGRLAAQLEHPNIGQVYDTGEERGFYYIAMEYLHGHDARAFLDHAITHRTPIPLDHVLTVITGVAAGLHHAHDKRDGRGRPLQIVHRDVSPSNIFVTYDGMIKLVDFGLAATQSSQFRAGMVQGKTAYMSPEQCRSLPLDRRSDVFSLGTVLYELTTGRRLFRTAPTDTNYEIMDRIVNGMVPPPSQVVPGYSAELQAIVMRALAVDVEDRYATAQELLIDLEAVARTERAALSAAALARYVKATFGDKPEPWRGLQLQDYGGHDDRDPADTDEFDEFDDEQATSLYSGSLDDLEEGWLPARTPRAPSAPPVAGPESRPSLSRLALPLQAEDSDVFESPLLAKLAQEPPPGELAARAEVERADLDDAVEDVEVIEHTEDIHDIDDSGYERSHRTPAPSEPVSVAQRRAATHGGFRPGSQPSAHRGTRPGTQPGDMARAPSHTDPTIRAGTAAELAAPGHRPTRWWLVGVVFLLIITVLAGTVYLLGLLPVGAAG